MRNLVKSFARSEDGAITVDWVVLTALIVGIQVVLLLTPMRGALVGVSESIGDKATEYGEFLED
jgi:Flp pilus assembly pilin Flp